MGREDAFIVSRATFKKEKQNRLARNTFAYTNSTLFAWTRNGDRFIWLLSDNNKK